MNSHLDKIYSERSESILKISQMDPHPVCSTYNTAEHSDGRYSRNNLCLYYTLEKIYLHSKDKHKCTHLVVLLYLEKKESILLQRKKDRGRTV